MRDDRTILIVGDHNAHMGTLFERVRDLGHPTVRRKSLEEAMDIAGERSFTFAAAILEVPTLAFNLREALATFQERTNSYDMRCIATGVDAAVVDRNALREAGVDLALWSPIEDTALRFQLNTALAPPHVDLLRSELRAPVEGRATIRAGGRVKYASIYSLSAGGAYLETTRPSMSGAQVSVSLALPGGEVSVASRVLYTNVPGNLSKGLLPMGMAVRFDDLDRAAGGAIRTTVESRSAELNV